MIQLKPKRHRTPHGSSVQRKGEWRVELTRPYSSPRVLFRSYSEVLATERYRALSKEYIDDPKLREAWLFMNLCCGLSCIRYVQLQSEKNATAYRKLYKVRGNIRRNKHVLSLMELMELMDLTSK
jgi:hypothetical protein